MKIFYKIVFVIFIVLTFINFIGYLALRTTSEGSGFFLFSFFVTLIFTFVIYYKGKKIKDSSFSFKKFNFTNKNQQTYEFTDEIRTNYTPNSFFSIWNYSVHRNAKQKERLNRSTEELNKILSFNPRTGIAKIQSNRKENLIYNTSLKKCSCEDFKQRNKPCKHIYKLAYALECINEFTDYSEIPPAIHKKYLDLNKEAQAAFMNLIYSYHHGKSNSYESLTDGIRSLYDSNLIVENIDYPYLVNKVNSKNDIIASLVSSKIEDVPKPSVTKAKMIEWIIENDSKTLKRLLKNNTMFTLDSELVPYVDNFYGMYSDNFFYDA